MPRPRRAAALWPMLAVSLVVLFAPDAPSGGPDLPGLDKVVHALVFGALAVTAVWRFGRTLPVALGLVAYAVGSELVQHWLLSGRSGDPLDVLADTIGAAIGWWSASSADARVASASLRQTRGDR